MAKIKYREALRAALREEMERDPSVFCIGEGIGERGGSYKVTEGLIAQFGAAARHRHAAERGRASSGSGVGAAIAGSRPVVEMLFIDFLLLAMDQVVNQAAKYRFMSGGQGNVPLVIRTQGGAGNSLAGQHSQSLEALFYHVPGLKVVDAVDARRREGPAQVRDPRRRPGHLHRAQAPLHDRRRGARGRGLPRPARPGRREAPRLGRDARRLVAHGDQGLRRPSSSRPRGSPSR